MSNIKEQLIRLGARQPNLQGHLRPILDHLSASQRVAKRPQSTDPQAITGALQKEFSDLTFSSFDIRDRGNSVLYTAVPDPKKHVIEGHADKQQRAFDKATLSKINGSLQRRLDKFAKARGYYVALYDLESWVRRFKVHDVSQSKIAPDAFFTQALWIEFQPFYPKDHWTPAKLINEGMPYLYHLTDSANASSIKSKGLTPRSSGGGDDPKHPFSYPDRVYLFKKRQDLTHALKDFVPTFEGENMGGITLTRTPHVSIFMIDLTELRPGTKFHEDTAYPTDGAVFTYTHIPKSAIARVITKDMSR
jgi:hypothetical protein